MRATSLIWTPVLMKGVACVCELTVSPQLPPEVIQTVQMATASIPQQWGPRHYEPAGLEVVLSESGLEYDSPAFQEKIGYGQASAIPQMTGEPTKTIHDVPGPTPESSGRTRTVCFPRTRRQRLICLVVGIALVAIVVGAAVGGTIASKRAKETSTSSFPATSTTTSTSSPTPSASSSSAPTPPKSIKKNSSLAVTAYRKVNGVEVHLFFQGPDNVVYQSVYDSSKGPSTANSSSLWQPPVGATTQPAATSPLCATTTIWDQYFQVSESANTLKTAATDSSSQGQIGLYHFSPPDNLLTGTNFNDQLKPPIQADGIFTFSLTSHPASRISCYWPYIVYHDVNNNFVEMRNDLDGFGKGTFSPSSGYTARSLKTPGAQGSSVAVVPLSTVMSISASRGGYGVIGQSPGGDLVAFIPDEQQTANVTRSWSTGANFPSINLPQGSSFAAFATARPGDRNNRTDTYVLYQTAGGAIEMVYRDDESDWKTAQPADPPAALAEADVGTDIACVTMPESMRDNVGRAVTLEAASTETRCYFQRGGGVVEVQLRQGGWVELGVVPMP
ncbi:hypothetical protein GE09DRAFT_171737 [Coniochaeta sp. 2T2.1]|nr:hypothetical protein GE09DRAFT_171737 [Coniochaeta sp. 2T2.1]